ncbi:hypothetical protein KM043_000321 [Ampulex compressa]|nr:hypothetical protein KM043_000321 [Ampulex compressa]
MPDRFTVDDFPTLRLTHVYVRDQSAVLRTINRILESGSKDLQVVSDFDLTLTKQHVNGKRVLSSFGIFGKCKQLPIMYSVESSRLYDKYRPIEIDPHLSVATKTEAMDTWMILAQDLLRGFEFDSQELKEVVQSYGTTLRDGTEELFARLSAAEVPILVFSAGLGDVVEAVLQYHGVLFSNVKIISNFLEYDGKKLNGFKNKRLIHVFNKNEHALEQDYFKFLEGKRNVILMGDSLGDADMVDGMDNTEAVLKIGFLYDNVEHNLPLYMQKFDIVLVDDQTMDVVSEILRRIL